MTNEEKIKDIDRQIEELKREKKRLSGQSIASLTNRLILIIMKNRQTGAIHIGARNLSCANDIWTPIMTLSKELHRPKHSKRTIMVRDMTEDERKISAAMATEMIDVWNKYVRKVYGDETND